VTRSAQTDQGFVLHRRRFRESSLIVEFLTAERGRIAAVARAALRPRGRVAANLQPGTCFVLGFAGRGELLTLSSAESSASGPRIEGDALYCLLYVNEVVMRLTAAHDPNRALYAAYATVISALGAGHSSEPALRRFEKAMLDALGLGLELRYAADSGLALDPAADYHYVPERGAVRRGPQSRGIAVTGATLLALGAGTLHDDRVLRESKRLMRAVIDYHLDGRPLAARDLFLARGAGPSGKN
jgi:DNA repair protein RecO (recombination protein O)